MSLAAYHFMATHNTKTLISKWIIIHVTMVDQRNSPFWTHWLIQGTVTQISYKIPKTDRKVHNLFYLVTILYGYVHKLPVAIIPNLCNEIMKQVLRFKDKRYRESKKYWYICFKTFPLKPLLFCLVMTTIKFSLFS